MVLPTIQYRDSYISTRQHTTEEDQLLHSDDAVLKLALKNSLYIQLSYKIYIVTS